MRKYEITGNMDYVKFLNFFFGVGNDDDKSSSKPATNAFFGHLFRELYFLLLLWYFKRDFYD